MNIGKNVHQIGGWWNETEGNTNLFLFSHLIQEEKITLIDTGSSIFPDAAIFPYMKTINLDPKDVSLILNTHGHIDHIGGNARLKEVSGAKIAAHEYEVAYIENHELTFENRIVSPDRRKRVLQLMGDNTKVDIILHGNDEIEIGSDRKLKAICTPGHSRGSLCFYDEEERILFSGDSVFLGETVVKMPAYNDVNAYTESLKRIGKLKIDFLVSAHYPPLRGENVKSVLRRCLRLVREVHQTVIDALKELKKPSGTLEIAEITCERLDYPTSIGPVAAHLDMLCNEGIVDKKVKDVEILWRLE